MNLYKSISLTALLALALTACNTVDGVGEDVSATGDVISETATDVQDDLN